MLRYLFLFAFLLTLPMQAQVQVVDSDEQTAVAHAQVMDETGKILGHTDGDGYLPARAYGHDISIQHIAYQTLQVKIPKNPRKKMVALQPLSYDLNEVEVCAPRHDYIRLRGYFRTYQLNDSCLKYYTDGVADYYLPLGRRGNADRKILARRDLKRTDLPVPDKKRKFYVSDFYLNVPCLEGSTLAEEKSASGWVVRDSVTHKIRAEQNCLPHGASESTLFGYTVLLAEHLLSEVYRMREAYVSFMDLLAQKRYRKLFYGHKKDRLRQMVEVTDELFILEREYVTRQQMKQQMKSDKDPALDCSACEADPRIPALPSFVREQIGSMVPR